MRSLVPLCACAVRRSTVSPAAVPPVMATDLRRNSRRPMSPASSRSARSLSRLSITSPFWMRTASWHGPKTRGANCACDPTRAPGEGTRYAKSALRLDLTLVPAPESHARQALQQDEDEHTGGRNEKDRSEHARDLQLIARLEDPEGEPGLGAARARHELRHHRTDECEPATDAQAPEEEGEGGGKAEITERLPARGAVEAEAIDKGPVGAGEAETGVGEHGKESDEPRADQEGEGNPRHPEDDQRRDGHERRYLKDHRVGKERALDPRRLREEHGEEETQHGRDEKGRSRYGQGHEQRGEEGAPVRDQGARDQEGSGEDVGRDLLHTHDAFPHAQREHAEQGRRDHAAAPPHVSA